MIRPLFYISIYLQSSYVLYKLSSWGLTTLLFSTSLFFFIKIFLLSGFLLSIYLIFLGSTRVTVLFGYTIILLFPLGLMLYVFFKNILVFLFFYEFFVLPSTLIIFLFSPNIRFIAAHLYFLLWTQFGSFLVVLGLICSSLKHEFFIEYSDVTSMLLLLGFGVKIPIWPFHFWLTKTHVEAPTFFSIYLSGFLVKTAVLGIIILADKFSVKMVLFFIIISMIGVIDSTLKLIIQVDLKKFVAYTTVQEMNLILLLVLYSDLFNYTLVGSFILVHTLLSTLFFYIVDILYKKFRGRTTNLVKGVWCSDVTFGLIIYISMMLYMGIPYTTKFFIELYLFFTLFLVDPFVCIILIVILNCVGSIFFGKIWFNVLFGLNNLSGITILKKKQVLFYLFYFTCFILFLFLSVFI